MTLELNPIGQNKKLNIAERVDMILHYDWIFSGFIEKAILSALIIYSFYNIVMFVWNSFLGKFIISLL